MRIGIEFRRVEYLMVRLLPDRMTLYYDYVYDSVVGGGGVGGRILNKSINVPESTFILYISPTSAYHTIYTIQIKKQDGSRYRFGRYDLWFCMSPSPPSQIHVKEEKRG